MTLDKLRSLLTWEQYCEFRKGRLEVRATTPHGTYTFEIESVSSTHDGVMLHLVEVSD